MLTFLENLSLSLMTILSHNYFSKYNLFLVYVTYVKILLYIPELYCLHRFLTPTFYVFTQWILFITILEFITIIFILKIKKL